MKTTKIVIVKHKPSGNLKIYGNVNAALKAVEKTRKQNEFSIYEDFIWGEINPSPKKSANIIQ